VHPRLGVPLVVAVATLAGVPARAEPEPRPRVTLFSANPDDPLAGRLAAELEVLGLDVTRSAIAPTVAMEEQVRQSFLAGSRAAVIADGHRTEFWIAEEGSDKVAMRQELEIEASPGLESVLSLRTVEFLRVSLGLVVGDAPRPPPPQPDGQRRFSLTLASGLLATSGRLGPLVTLSAGMRARMAGPVGVEIVAYAPLTQTRISEPEGQIASSVWLVGGGLVLATWSEPRVSGELAAGALAVVLRSTGAGNPLSNVLWTGAADQGVGMAFYGRAAVRFRLAPHLALRVEATSGSTAALRPVIVAQGELDERRVAVWGTVFVAAVAGFEARF
jgi:hypothetical protein